MQKFTLFSSSLVLAGIVTIVAAQSRGPVEIRRGGDSISGGATNAALLNGINVFTGTNRFSKPIIAPGVPRVLYKSSAEATHTGDTAVTTLGTFTIPAGTVGSNDILSLQATLFRAAIGTAQYWFEVGGTNIYTPGIAGANPAAPNVGPSLSPTGMLMANNSTTSQVRPFNDATVATWAMTASVDFTADVTVNIKGQLSVGSDTLTNRTWMVILYPAP